MMQYSNYIFAVMVSVVVGWVPSIMLAQTGNQAAVSQPVYRSHRVPYRISVRYTLRRDRCGSQPSCKVLSLPTAAIFVQSHVGTEDIASLSGDTSLQSLFISSDSLTDQVLKSLGSISSLTDLTLRSSRLTDRSMEWVSRQRNLEYLDLTGCDVSDEGVYLLQKCTKLSFLNLQSTRITDKGLARLVGLKSLDTLWLMLTDVGDEGVKTIAELPHLKCLWLANTNVTDQGMEYLSRSKSIETLVISNPVEFARDTTPRSIDRPCTEITDKGCLYLRHIKTLKLIDVRGTRVSDTALADLHTALPSCEVVR